MFNFVKSQRCRIINEKRSAGSVKHVLPSHARDIYKEAFNSAWDQYKDKTIGVMTPVAKKPRIKWPWAAVKHEYAKGMMINGIKIVKPVA